MNWAFVVAGVISILTCLAHIWAGEFMLKRMPATQFNGVFPKEDPAITRQTFRFVWHTLSVDFLIWGIVLLVLGLTHWIESPDVVARLIALCFGGYAVIISLIPALSMKRWDTLYRAPQWLLGVAIAAFAWGGTL